MLRSSVMKKTVITKDAQMNIRLDGADKILIEKAAKKSKVRPSAFIRDAAIAWAKEYFAKSTD